MVQPTHPLKTVHTARWMACRIPRRCRWLLLALASLAACQKDAASPQADVQPDRPAPTSTGDPHSGWWCVEHGVPESVCSRCSAKAAVEFRNKGDWCEEHQRADSQCFICHPEKQEEFANLYKQKFGKAPPAPTQ